MSTETIDTNATDDKTALAIRDSINQVQGALSEFDKISSGLAALDAKHPKNLACDVTTAKGMKDAIAGRAAWREPRIAVEKARKAAKAPVLSLGRDIDARAAYITQRLIEGESNYDDQIKAEEARREAEKQARIAAEQARVALIQSRIRSFGSAVAAASGQLSSTVAGILKTVSETNVDDSYEEFRQQAEGAKSEAIAQLQSLHTAALEREAEAARLIAEREELARLRAAEEERQRVERERIASEQRAAAERMAAERAEMERQRAAARAEQARLDAEAAAARREADAKAAAERAEADRVAREARDAEERRLAAERAELRRQQEEEAAARRRAAEAAEAAASRLRNAAPQMLDALKAVQSSGGWVELEAHVRDAVSEAIEAAA